MITKNKDGSVTIDLENDDSKLKKVTKITLAPEIVKIIKQL